MSFYKKKSVKLLISVAAISSMFTTVSLAADYIEPIIVAPEVVSLPTSNTGWYLRGDIGYSKPKYRGADFPKFTTGSCGSGCVDTNGEGSISGSLKGSFLIGGGIGYQVTDYFRTDLTLDYMTRSKGSLTHCEPSHWNSPNCTSTDGSKFTALSLLANAYVDLANINGITPYIGAGIGGTKVKWSNLAREGGDFPVNGIQGNSDWRFTYALMAGVSYDLTESLKLDAGYRFRRVNGGKMAEAYGNGNGAAHQKAMNIHDIRVGLRYQFAQ